MICYDTLKIFEIKLGFRMVFVLLERSIFRKIAGTRYGTLCEIKVPEARCGFKYQLSRSPSTGYWGAWRYVLVALARKTKEFQEFGGSFAIDAFKLENAL